MTLIGEKEKPGKNYYLALIALFGFFLAYWIVLLPFYTKKNRQNNLQDTIALKSKQIVEEQNLHITPTTPGAPLLTSDTSYVLSNELITIYISKKSGSITKALLKQYKTYQADSLNLLIPDSSYFALQFFKGRELINTAYLDFSLKSIDTTGDSIKLSLWTLVDTPFAYLQYNYILTKNSYCVDFNVTHKNLEKILADRSNDSLLLFVINNVSPIKEKSPQDEKMFSGVYYKYKGENVVNEAGIGRNEEITPLRTIQWIAFKQRFFSVAYESIFDKTSGNISIHYYQDTSILLAKLTSQFTLDLRQTNQIKIYFIPNKIAILESFNNQMEELVGLGWTLFRWINKYLIIPIFNFFEKMSFPYPLIILILTIVIKVILTPLTHKNFISSLKMRALQPYIAELNQKYANNPTKKMQAMMELYTRMGVSPLSGCIPMLLQLPILIAMFKFFPSSIELRHQKFLWIDDFSSFDSIISFSFAIPLIGAHISGLALLMSLSTIIYNKLFSTPPTDPTQKLQMKILTYAGPIIMFVIFNHFSAALNLYYFLFNLFSIAQYYVFKKFIINEEKIIQEMKQKKLEMNALPQNYLQAKMMKWLKKKM